MYKILLILQFLLSACSFYSLAGSIPPHIKSIAIPLMNNQTPEISVSSNITDGIIQQFNESGVLLIDNQDRAHSVLNGTIKKIHEDPYTYNRNELISEYRYKIDIDIEWYDLIKEKIILEKSYSGFGAYGISGDISSDGIDNDFDGKIDNDDDDEFGDPRSFATKVAVRKIAEDILNDIMTTW